MSTPLQVSHLGRYASIGALLLKHRGAARAGSDDVGDEPTAADAEQLVADLEQHGPTFVKLGQLLSTRADLLPPVYLDALARLQDDVEPVPFAEVEAAIVEGLGVRISDAFQELDHRPLASASLGQVHRAVLRDGRAVAVKVQRPGIRDRALEDIGVIEELAGFVDSHTRTGQQLQFADMAGELRRSLEHELDYRREAENLTLLGDLLAPHDLITVPRPIPDFTSEGVLTMELVDGRNVASLGPLARLEVDGRPLLTQLFRAYLDQILVHGFVHADPHPGNVLLTSDGRLALIDLGMVVRLAPDLRDRLARVLASMSEGRATEVADTLVAMGHRTPAFDGDEYRRRITRLVLDHQTTSVGSIRAGVVMGELARAAAECGLQPPAEMTLVGKALLNLDRVAQVLDPDFDPNLAIRDHTAELLRDRLLGSASPASLLHTAMDAKEFAEQLPGRVNKVMDALAEGQLTLQVEGIDEALLMRSIEKVANRVASGLVVAALIVGAAMLLRIDTEATLLGYPALGILVFLGAAVLGVAMVASGLLADRRSRSAARSSGRWRPSTRP